MRRVLALLVFLMIAVVSLGGQIQPVVVTPSTTTATVLQNAVTGTGNGTTLNVSGYTTARVTVTCAATCTASVIFEGSLNNSTWDPLYGKKLGIAGDIDTGLVPTVAGTFQYNVQLMGARFFRARIASYTSGTVTVTSYVSTAPPDTTDMRLTQVPTSMQNLATSALQVTANDYLFTTQEALTLIQIWTAALAAGLPATVGDPGAQGAQALSVQGVTGMVPLSTTCANCLTQADSRQDNTTFTTGTTNAVPISGILDDVASAIATENSAAIARITSNKAFHVNFRNASGTEIGTASTPVRVDPTGTTTQPVSGTVTANIGTSGSLALDATLTGRLPAGGSPAENESNTNTSLSRIGNFNFVFDGANWDRWTGAVSASQSGTWTMQPGNTANTTPWLFTIQEGGNPATVRNLTANDALNVAIVDSSGNQITSFGGSGGTAQNDNTAVAQITGAGALYDTTPPSITDGNVGLFRMNSSRQLQVDCVAGCSGSSFADNAAFTFGTTPINIFGGVFDDVGSNTATENSASVARITQNKALHINFRNASGTEIGTAAAPVRTDPTGTTTQPVSGTVTANAGTGTFAISAASLPLPTGASTLAEQQTQTTALQIIDNLPVAQGSTTSGQSGALVQGAVTTAAPTYTTAQTSPLSLTTAGALRTDSSATTQPVSGTVTANVGTFPDNEPFNVAQINGVTPLMGTGNTGTGSLRVTIATDQTQLTNALKVDGSAVTQPVSGTVSVTGVATAANQTTMITALQLIDDPVQVLGTDTYTEATSKGMTLGAVRRDADTTLVGTTNEFGPLQMDANGRLKVEVFSGETLPVSGTVTTTPPSNASTNVAQFGGTNVSTGTGAGGAGIPRVTISNDSSLAANQSVNVNQINGQAVASPDANSYQITPGAATATAAAAASACNILSAASTNSTNCKNAAGNIYGYEIYNTTTTVYYLRLYNLSSAPTCSSATGFIRSIPIPPAASAGQVGGAVSNQAVGVNFGTGIGYCITGGSASTDNTNAATGIFGEIRYK